MYLLSLLNASLMEKFLFPSLNRNHRALLTQKTKIHEAHNMLEICHWPHCGEANVKIKETAVNATNMKT